MFVIKTFIVLFLLAWFFFGGWMVANYARLFGPHKDDPAESAGARSFGIAHIIAVWIGGVAIALFYLFK